MSTGGFGFIFLQVYKANNFAWNNLIHLKLLVISILLFSSCEPDLKTDIDFISNKIDEIGKTGQSDFYVVTADSLLFFSGGTPPREFYVYTDVFIDSRPDRDIVLIEFKRGNVSIKQFYFSKMEFEKIGVRKCCFKYSDTIKLEFIKSLNRNFLELN